MSVQTDWATLGALICFRLLNGFFLQSAFHPDEEWQSTEVAHILTFGFGYLTWEWEKCIALRSVAHPALFAVMFWTFKQLHLDFPDVIAVSPRLLQSCIAGLTDYAVIQLAKAWYGGAVMPTEPGAEDVNNHDVTALGSEKGGISKKRGNDLAFFASEIGRDRTPASKVYPGSAERKEEPISARENTAEAEDSFRFYSLTSRISHWVNRYRSAEDLADFSKGSNLVCCITLCFLLSWFNFFCLPRTHSNCIEACANVYALLFFARARGLGTLTKGRPVNTRRSSSSSSKANKPRRAWRASAAPLSVVEGSTFETWKSSVVVPEEGREKIPKCEIGGQEGACHHEFPHDMKTCYLPPQYVHSSTFYTALALSCAALSVVMRPPAACFWIVFCLCKLMQYLKGTSPYITEHLEVEDRSNRIKNAAVFLGLTVSVGLVAIGCTIYLDFLFYGKLTFTPLNFAKFNMLMDPGRHFGAEPWHYYLLNCPTVVLLTFYPFFVLGLKYWLGSVYRFANNCYVRRVHKTGKKGIRFLEIAKYFTVYVISRDDGAALLGTLSSLLLLSLSTHKEYRLTISFMPIVLTYTGIGIAGFLIGNAQLCTALTGQRERSGTLHSPHVKTKGFMTKLAPQRRANIVLFAFVAQVLFAVYFGFFHRRGAPRVMRFLRQLPEGSSVFFLSPAYDLPYYSQVHQRFPMGFLDGSPRFRHGQNFPPSWQDRFWAPQERRYNVEFLDTFFVDSYGVPSLAGAKPSTTPTAPDHSAPWFSCPAPSSSQILSSVFSLPLPLHMSSARSTVPDSQPNALPSYVSTSSAPRAMDSRRAPASTSQSKAPMRSDIYSRIPEEGDQISFSVADSLFGREKGTKEDTQNVDSSGTSGATEMKQSGIASSKIQLAEEYNSFVSPNALKNSWFGDAAHFHKTLCQAHRWAHSKDCEENPSFEECLDYRFLVPLRGQLPTHFVVTSGVYDKISEWFSSRGYVVCFGPIFDSVVAESPRGKVLWQSYYILQRRLPAKSAVFI